jgi:hypothetical protein
MGHILLMQINLSTFFFCNFQVTLKVDPSLSIGPTTDATSISDGKRQRPASWVEKLERIAESPTTMLDSILIYLF